MYVFTNDEALAIDHQIIEQFGFPSLILMENAGNAFREAVCKEMGIIQGRKFIVFCGPGNNGADGLVIARKLLCSGGDVTLVSPPPGNQTNHAAWMTQFQMLKHFQSEHLRLVAFEEVDLSSLNPASFDLIIDALFGVGVNPPLRDEYSAIVDWIQGASISVAAVDLPSPGVQNSSFVVSFGVIKRSSIYNGYAQSKKLYFAPLDAPYYEFNSDEMVNDPVHLPSRNPTGHKGSFGQALFIGGAANYYGAPYFNAMSFLRSGGGYARVAAPQAICPIIAGLGPEFVMIPLPQSSDSSICDEAFDTIASLLNQHDVVTIGCGLSLTPSAEKLLRNVMLADFSSPLIIDGDGLTLLSQNMELLEVKLERPLILTPHPGEMSRLAQRSISDILAYAPELVPEMARKWNATIVLKSARTIIGTSDGSVWYNMSGNDGMATPGTGDVLTGMIAAISCQSISLVEAVRTAVFLHGLAGDLAAEDTGRDGITATTLMDYIPSALQEFRNNPSAYCHYRITLLP